MTRTQRIAAAGIGTALALLLSYVESLFPLPIPVPGVKLGLANTIVLVLLLREEEAEAFLVAALRVLLSAALFSGYSGFFYAIAGSLVSCAVMALARRWGVFGTVGLSVMGGVTHSLSQLCVAVLVTQTPQLFSYAGILTAAGMVSGILTGTMAAAVFRLLPKTGSAKQE